MFSNVKLANSTYQPCIMILICNNKSGASNHAIKISIKCFYRCTDSQNSFEPQTSKQMKMRFIAIALLGLTIHVSTANERTQIINSNFFGKLNFISIFLCDLQSAYTTPVPGCDSKTPAPEIYTQNNGQPVVLYAYGDSLSSVDESSSNDGSYDCDQAASDDQASGYSTGVASEPSSNDSDSDSDSDDSEMSQAQSIADTVPEAQSDSVQQSNEPCKVETNTEVVHTPGETFVHHPGPIYINQPPTRLIIKHAPYIVRPSPIVVNQGGKKITKAYTTKYLPSPVHVRPVIVRLVKPITKKVLIEKPAKPCKPDTSVVVAPEIPNPCNDVGPTTPAPCQSPAPAPAPCSGSDDGVELDSVASVDAVELQSDDGELYGYETATAVGDCGCQ